jgi:hypothetical protein
MDNNQSKGQSPTHNICVQAGKDKNLVKIGVAWFNPEKGFFNISLNKMMMFENKPRPENQERQGHYNQPPNNYAPRNGQPKSLAESTPYYQPEPYYGE